jgi:hypothetical protein
MLTDEPAESRNSSVAFGQAVSAFRQCLSQLRQAPGGQLLGVLDRADDVEAACGFARKDGELEGLLAVEPLGLQQSPADGGLGLQPGLEARLVDEVDDMRRPAAVGLEEGSEVGHGGGFNESRPCRTAVPTW